MLFPPLGALIGPQTTGALAAVAAAALFAALVAGHAGHGTGARVAVVLFAAGTVASLVSGRLTFALGVAVGLAAVLAAGRRRAALAGLGGAVTALASPVAALFAGLAGAALVLADPSRRRAGLALGAGAALPVVALAVAFPQGGTFPFAPTAFLPAVVAGLALAAVARTPVLRAGGLLYALLCVAVLVVPSPIGGNAARLGTLLALPLAALVLLPRRPVVFAVLLVPLLYWTWQPAVRDWRRQAGDPTTRAAYFAPLVAALRDERPTRVEVPLTQSHGEAVHLAGGGEWAPIARGWERQLDRARNALFYDDRPLTAARYRRWLLEQGIGHVALPGPVPLDAAGEEEARLVASGLPFLEERGRAGPWRLFRVRGGRLARGAARVERLLPQGFVLTGSQPGTTDVRVRFTPYWVLRSGQGCVEPAPGGWTRVRTREPGRVEVGVRFALDRVRATTPRCT